jgi:hypothetical protein
MALPYDGDFVIDEQTFQFLLNERESRECLTSLVFASLKLDKTEVPSGDHVFTLNNAGAI